MRGGDLIHEVPKSETDRSDGAILLRPLIESTKALVAEPAPPIGVVVGELIAIKDGGRTPLVRYDSQPEPKALAARTVVDLHRAHIGRQVVIMFECGNPARPIVMGLLRDEDGWPLSDRPGTVEADADGERLIVSAKQELVVRCGKASITLHRDGKVTIRGTHVVSHAEGVNRIRGGSVQLN